MGEGEEVTTLQGLKSKAEPREVEWEYSCRREGRQLGRPVRDTVGELGIALNVLV